MEGLAVGVAIKRDRWGRETADADDEREKRLSQELRRRASAPLWAMSQLDSLAELFGGGELGRKAAALILESQKDLKPGTLGQAPAAQSAAAPVTPNPAESD